MKNSTNFKTKLFTILTLILVFLALFVYIRYKEYNEYKINFNYKINAILEKIENKQYDISKDEIIEILQTEKTNNNILKKYGYDIETDSYIIKNEHINFKYNLINITLLLNIIIILLYIFIESKFNNDKEINKIIKLIENINHKNYELKISELSEDKLSILKEEIYKTTIMLKENADNSLKDKINIKNSLQDISHQIKTPLTSINIMLDNIIDDPDMNIEIRHNFLKQIKREITNISFLVQSILKLSKFESNTIDFNRKEIYITKILDETIKNVANLCDLKNIEIKVNNKSKNKIYCDPKWQIEAVTNILKNAVEYSIKGGKVLIECEDNNLYSQIKIIDYGKGMDDEDIKNIFKRFYKGKDSEKDSIGIGLSLSKTIIEKDKGKITIESKKNKGTTFIIKYFL